jgi:hypothetical protein
METQFERYLGEAKGADLRDKQIFSRLVGNGLALTGMTLREAAVTFKTAPGTVSRWENGYCAPPMIAREKIVSVLTARVRRIHEKSAVAVSVS